MRGETKLKSARSNLWVHRPEEVNWLLSVRGGVGGKHLTADRQTLALQGRGRQHIAWHHFHRPVFDNPLLFNGARPCAFVTINLLGEVFYSQVIPYSPVCLNNSILIWGTTAYRHFAGWILVKSGRCFIRSDRSAPAVFYQNLTTFCWSKQH